MTVAADLYPWDVDGDPAAADRIAGLGVTEVSLAAVYHAVRAVTPFHPEQRVVARDAAAYYRLDPARWPGAALRPVVPGGGQAGSFERAADALHAAGLRVNAWVVVAHNGRIGAAHPECAVRNAYGDVYPWALCIGSPPVRDYAATLAAEVAALECADAVELEACGWYGFDHGGAHDKTGGVPPEGTPGWLLDACFCPACRTALQDAGVDPGELARQVRAALDAAYQRDGLSAAGPEPAGSGPLRAHGGTIAVAGARTVGSSRSLGGLDGPAGALAAVRAATAERFLRRVVTAVRGAAPGKDVFLHAHPDQREAGSNPGYDPAVLLGPDGADGIILQCPGPAAGSAALVQRMVKEAPAGRRIAATLPAVTALGANTSQLAAKASAMLAAGATDLRLYHAGLASAADHTAMREVAEAT